MTKPTLSLTTLLERTEGELQTADGRTVRVCRGPSGDYWVVDRAERVVPLHEFAAECSLAAHEYCARARAEEMRRLATRAREMIVRFARHRPWTGARAHA
jgi:hypothetical protein